MMAQMTDNVNCHQASLEEIHSLTTLNQFYSEEKYCDVTIRVENESFRSHRFVLAMFSEYFDVVFGGEHFTERRDVERGLPIVLHGVDAADFGKILHFMYTGRVTITESDCFSLLLTSDFLMLRNSYIEKWCVEFIRSMILKAWPLIPNAWQIFAFARAGNQRESLSGPLSLYICKHIDHYSRDPRFAKISSDDLRVIFRGKYLIGCDENQLLKAFCRWVVRQPRKEGSKYCNVFHLNVNSSKITSQEGCQDSAKRSLEPDEKMYADIMNVHSKLNVTRESTLHVYVRCYGRTEIFSTKKSTMGWSLTHEFDESLVVFTVIPSGYNLYHLTHDCSEISLFGDEHYFGPDFSASRSVCYSDPQNSICTLKAPPRWFPMDLSSIKGDIYLYSKFNNADHPHLVADPRRARDSDAFTYEEFSRGICVYRCEFDRWFPVPAMKVRTYNAHMTTDNDLLYVLGGGTSSPGTYATVNSALNIVQAYDYRTPHWHELPRAPCTRITAAAAHRGRIYVVDCPSTTGCLFNLNAYDPVAGKWETCVSNEFSQTASSVRLVSYDKELWLIYPYDRMNVKTFDSSTGVLETRPGPSLADAFRNNNIETEGDAFPYFVAALVF